MSFGVSFGDVVVASKLASKVYKACKDSGESFQRLAGEVSSLHVVLKETQDYLDEFHDLQVSRVNRLQILTDGCQATLTDLERLIRSYDTLGTQLQRTWDRFRFGLQDLTEIRSRLVSSVTLLTAFNTSLIRFDYRLKTTASTETLTSTISSSTFQIEKRLNKLVCEVRAGCREGSIVTTPDVAETIDSPNVWAQLQRELEDWGISPAVVEENHEYISQWMKGALADGLLDEDVPTEVDNPQNLSTHSDSGYGESPLFSPAALTIANNEFEQDLREKQAGRSVEEVLKPLAAEVVVKPSGPEKVPDGSYKADQEVIRQEHGRN